MKYQSEIDFLENLILKEPVKIKSYNLFENATTTKENPETTHFHDFMEHRFIIEFMGKDYEMRLGSVVVDKQNINIENNTRGDIDTIEFKTNLTINPVSNGYNQNSYQDNYINDHIQINNNIPQGLMKLATEAMDLSTDKEIPCSFKDHIEKNCLYKEQSTCNPENLKLHGLPIAFFRHPSQDLQNAMNKKNINYNHLLQLSTKLNLKDDPINTLKTTKENLFSSQKNTSVNNNKPS